MFLGERHTFLCPLAICKTINKCVLETKLYSLLLISEYLFYKILFFKLSMSVPSIHTHLYWLQIHSDLFQTYFPFWHKDQIYFLFSSVMILMLSFYSCNHHYIIPVHYLINLFSKYFPWSSFLKPGPVATNWWEIHIIHMTFLSWLSQRTVLKGKFYSKLDQ